MGQRLGERLTWLWEIASVLCACALVLTAAPAVARHARGGQRGEAGAPLFGTAYRGAVVAQAGGRLSTRWTRDVSRTHPLPEYPRPQLTRPRWLNLNGPWQFQPAGPRFRPPVGHNLRRRIVVPYPPESSLSGIGRHVSRMWYRRLFDVPAGWLSAKACSDAACPHLLLHFGAVNYSSVIYVNGRLVAKHSGGYSSFSVDITGDLVSHGHQELIVGVTNTVEHDPVDQVVGKQRLSEGLGAIWYSASSGIWQTVWIEPVPQAHIDRLAMTPDLVHRALSLDALTAGGGRQRVLAVAYAGNRRVGSVVGPANRALRLPVPHPVLWTPDHPFLYRLEVTLLVDGRRVDSVGSYFGMRSISVGLYQGQPHLLLNGQFVFELGVLDQGYWPDGLYTAPTDAAMRYDLSEDKALGFNTVLKHMKVEPDRWYYWADRLGLLVWQDMPALARPPVESGAEGAFETQLHDMVLQLQSHPAIVAWVPFNEGWGVFAPDFVAAQVKAWDPSRLVDVDSGQNWSLLPPSALVGGDVYDNHAYPAPSDRGIQDRRAAFDGEYGGLGLYVPGHSWSTTVWSYEVESDPAELTARYTQLAGAVRDLEVHCGLSGAIYTQAYDVEEEDDGLRSYDRDVLKVDANQVRAANAGVLAAAGSLAPGSCPASP